MQWCISYHMLSIGIASEIFMQIRRRRAIPLNYYRSYLESCEGHNSPRFQEDHEPDQHIRTTSRRRLSGGVRPPSPPKHDTMALEEPFCARGSIRLSLFLYYELLTRTYLSGSSLIFLSLLDFRVGSSLFGIPFVKPFLL